MAGSYFPLSLHTYWEGVEEEEKEEEQDEKDDKGDAVPLVILPEDVPERLPWRCQPQEGGCWSADESKQCIILQYNHHLFLLFTYLSK